MSSPPPHLEDPAMTPEEKEVHLNFMREALSMAQLALSTNETPVGCVLVYKNQIIARGMNATNRTFNGTRHAEFIAISSLLSQNQNSGAKGTAVLQECDLYVTVEPCIMCASLLRQFGIRKVFFGAGNEKFGGTGGVLSVNRGNGAGRWGMDGGEREGDYVVSGGWLRDEAVGLLRGFYEQENGRAPVPRRRGGRGGVDVA